MYIVSVVVWLVLVAATAVLEFLTRDYFATGLCLSGVVALVLALCAVDIYWQVGVFLILMVLLLAVGRPLMKKYFPLKRPQFAGIFAEPEN